MVIRFRHSRPYQELIHGHRLVIGHTIQDHSRIVGHIREDDTQIGHISGLEGIFFIQGHIRVAFGSGSKIMPSHICCSQEGLLG